MRKLVSILLCVVMLLTCATSCKKEKSKTSGKDKNSGVSETKEGRGGDRSGNSGGGGGSGGSDGDSEDTEDVEELLGEQIADLEPEELSIKNICQLATLECYFNNVAKAQKTGGTGIAHIGEKDRVFWVEYSAVATLGVDASQVSIEVVDNMIYVFIPDATVLEKVSIVPDSYNKDSVIQDLDGKINSNDITAADITLAVDASLVDLQLQVEGDTMLLSNAKERAKVLIKDYIEKINEYSGKQYIIVFRDPSEKGDIGS